MRVTIILDPHLPDLLFVPPNRPQSELCIHRIALYVHNRLNACGGPQVDQAKRLKELEQESSKLKRLVASLRSLSSLKRWLSMLWDMPSIRFRQSDESNLGEFPRLGMKKGITACFTKVAREKPQTTYDNGLPDFGLKFVEGYHAAATGPDLIANAPFEN